MHARQNVLPINALGTFCGIPRAVASSIHRIRDRTGVACVLVRDIGSTAPEFQPMSEISFETALDARIEEMLDACTRCGKCVEVCPSVTPAGITDASAGDIIGGILDIVRSGEGPDVSRKWASACMLSGECIEACDYGVNPRFLLAMARVAITKASNELPERRRQGIATIPRGQPRRHHAVPPAAR